MGKIVFMITLLSFYLYAQESKDTAEILQKHCLSCHQAQQIPNTLIYKRYLMKYSTQKRMYEAMYAYLKDPDKSRAIVPAPFFLKFPMKEKMNWDDHILQEGIEAFLDKYDVKKKLVLEK